MEIEFTRKLDHDTMYRALINKDETYEGLFYACVKTTGIFCRPACTARKPRRENVEFVNSIKEALDLGYRPCRVCHPLDPNGSTPEWLAPIMERLEAQPQGRIRDSELLEQGVNPHRIRRWFLKNYRMTFQAYQRYLRINGAIGKIRIGEKVVEAAFNSGYDSLSAFNYSFKKATGFSPKDAGRRRTIDVTRILTPLGPMMAAASEKGLCLLEFTDRRMLERQFSLLEQRMKARMLPGHNPLFEKVKEQLNRYFEGKLKEFDLPLELPGTPFQQRAWQSLIKIPYGITRSYKQQAQAIGLPKAVRAVARANGENRIAIIIPCHRVIGSDGELTGYGGGLWRKKYLLDLERASDET